MSNLIDMVKGQLSDQFISQLADKVGGSKEQTAAAAEGAISTLIGALSKNVQDPQQAEQLAQALERDHDGSILNNLGGMLLGNQQAANPKTTDGAGILSHILGGNLGNVTGMISKLSGLNKSGAGSILSTLAPLVMGALGKQKSQGNLGASGLTSLLTGAVSEKQGQDSNFGMIMKFLDSDGDGSVLNELTSIGSSLLGSFFKR